MSKTTTTTTDRAQAPVELNETQLREVCPAAFAKAPASGVSGRYSFVRTADLLPVLHDHGFVPTSAVQPRNAGNVGQHRIVLFHKNHLKQLQVGKLESAPRFILSNSHNRTSRCVMWGGYFRLVCSNGMVIPSGMASGLSRTHIGLNGESIKQLIGEMAHLLDNSQARVEAFRERKLNAIEKNTLAAFALEARYRGWDSIPVAARELLTVRRDEDNGDDLWTVFNRIQENVVRGGVPTLNGRRSRGVTSFYADMAVNRRIWEGAEALLTGGTRALQKFRKDMALPA